MTDFEPDNDPQTSDKCCTFRFAKMSINPVLRAGKALLLNVSMTKPTHILIELANIYQNIYRCMPFDAVKKIRNFR
jgi:hypothetical protein